MKTNAAKGLATGNAAFTLFSRHRRARYAEVVFGGAYGPKTSPVAIRIRRRNVRNATRDGKIDVRLVSVFVFVPGGY